MFLVILTCIVAPFFLLLGHIFDKFTFFEGTVVGDWWNLVFVEIADRRTNDWPLLKSILPITIILLFWFGFVRFWGPRVMANRRPFQMKKLIIAYNAIQVCVSVYITWQAFYHGYFKGVYSLRCQPVDPTRSPAAMRAARSFYVYFLAKISELLDTVFFVLRKKNNQISFLHLYHHSGMVAISWGLVKYYPGGHVAFAGMINSFVHAVMYTYYMLSAMGPEYQKYLWWKKYITTMQMIQFGLAFIHFSQLLWNDCGFPRWTILFSMPNAIFLFLLFNDFYQKAYKKHQEAKKSEETALKTK